MRDPKRIPIILKEIERMWQKYPQLRLGQLIKSVEVNPTIDVFYIEDRELIELLKKEFI